MRTIAMSVWLATALVASCTSTTTKTRVVTSDATSVQDSGASGTDGADGSDGADGATTATDGSTSATDGVDGVDGTDGATTATDGTDSETTATDGVDGNDGFVDICGTETEGKGIGEPCTSHSECSTGYCYDEAYLNEDGGSTYRFCTAKCTGCTTVGNCDDWPKGPGVKQNTCYIFKTAFINQYDISLDSLCLPTCTSDADCTGLGPYSKCDKIKYSWEDGEECFGGVQKVCQPPEFEGPLCE